MTQSKKLCVKCVREKIATMKEEIEDMKEKIEEFEQRVDSVEHMLGQLIQEYVQSTMGQ